MDTWKLHRDAFSAVSPRRDQISSSFLPAHTTAATTLNYQRQPRTLFCPKLISTVTWLTLLQINAPTYTLTLPIVWIHSHGEEKECHVTADGCVSSLVDALPVAIITAATRKTWGGRNLVESKFWNYPSNDTSDKVQARFFFDSVSSEVVLLSSCWA